MGGGGLSGTFEFVGEQAKQGAKGVGNAVKSVGQTAAGQITGNGGAKPAASNMSGSFDLSGGKGADLFAPDIKKQNPVTQMMGNQKPLSQTAQQAATSDRQYSPDEMQKIQKIEQELRSMHKTDYYDPLIKKVEDIRRQREENYEKKEEAQQQKKMEDLQQKQQKGQDDAVFRAQRSSEIKGNLG